MAPLDEPAARGSDSCGQRATLTGWGNPEGWSLQKQHDEQPHPRVAATLSGSAASVPRCRTRYGNLWHLRETGSKEVNSLPFHLELEGKVNASSQNQAHPALLFLCRELLERIMLIKVRHGKGDKDRHRMLPTR
jgi:hypothetical protein